MLIPIPQHWQQTAIDLLNLSVHSEHPRTRERFSALYHLAVHGGGATAYAGIIDRDRITVMDWVRKYNLFGPAAIKYQHSGGNAPLFHRSASKR